MGQRTELHQFLCETLATLGPGFWGIPDTQADIVSLVKHHVYYQPPASLQITYPCVLYALSDIQTKFADNIPYIRGKQYSLTVIDKNPDCPIVDTMSHLPRCTFDRMYLADNLYHWVFIMNY